MVSSNGWCSGPGRHAAVMGVAAVADDHVLDQQVQNAVEQGRADQDGPCQPLSVQPVRDRRRQAGQRPEWPCRACAGSPSSCTVRIRRTRRTRSMPDRRSGFCRMSVALRAVTTRPEPAPRRVRAARNRDRESGYSRESLTAMESRRRQQLAGQLAEEAEDHHDVQDAGRRLRRADAGRLPGHPRPSTRAPANPTAQRTGSSRQRLIIQTTDRAARRSRTTGDAVHGHAHAPRQTAMAPSSRRSGRQRHGRRDQVRVPHQHGRDGRCRARPRTSGPPGPRPEAPAPRRGPPPRRRPARRSAPARSAR